MNEDMDDRIREEGRRRIREERDERSERRNNQQRMRQKVSRSLAEATLNVLKRLRGDDDSSEISEDTDEYSEDEKEEKKKERRGRPKKKKTKREKKKKKKRMMSDDSSDEEDDEEDAEDSEDDEDDEEDAEDSEDDEDGEDDEEDAEKEKVSNWEQLKRLQSKCFVWVLQRYDVVLKHKSVLWIAQMIEWATSTKIKVRWWTSIPELKKKKKPGRPKMPPGPKQLTWGPWRETNSENIIDLKIVKLVIEMKESKTIKDKSRRKIQKWISEDVLPMWYDDFDNEYHKRIENAEKGKNKKKVMELKRELKKCKSTLCATVKEAMES